jgi:MSHA biogenesis protein MshI
VALSFTSEGIALAISQYADSQKTAITHCEFIHTNNKQAELKALTEKHQLEQYDCHLVLASDDYRLMSIEQPAVADDELTEEIRWKISDLIEFPVDDAIIDYYPLPTSERANSNKMIEVIATPKSAIQPLVDLCTHSELQLHVIDIQETTLRNLATLLPENDRGIAVLHLQKGTGRITIEKQGSIYLNRKLATGSDRLGLTKSFLSEEQIAMEQSGLALEIQRSFDYVESFYGLPPISGLAVIPLMESTQDLLNFLNNNHGITARIMDLSTIIDGDILLDDATQSLCTAVIGATLRNSLETL